MLINNKPFAFGHNLTDKSHRFAVKTQLWDLIWHDTYFSVRHLVRERLVGLGIGDIQAVYREDLC